VEPAFLRAAVLPPPRDGEPPREGHPWGLPAIAALQGDGLALDPAVTFLVGENGSGKSTLVEAIAVAAGMNPEGGSSNFGFATREEPIPLGDAIRLTRGVRRPRTDFFLRAESLFNAGSYLDRMTREDPTGRAALASYGGISLHEQSHGESFLAVILNRFGPDGLYVLDEPEAALSAQNCLTLIRRMHELVQDGSQFLIATHSPLLLAYPGAAIYELSPDGAARVDYDDAAPVRLTRAFLRAPERFLGELLDADRD